MCLGFLNPPWNYVPEFYCKLLDVNDLSEQSDPYASNGSTDEYMPSTSYQSTSLALKDLNEKSAIKRKLFANKRRYNYVSEIN